MITLVFTPRPGAAGWFDVEMPDGTPLGRTRQPLLDGARWLLREDAMGLFGHGPDTLMTARAHDSPYPSFKPAPIAALAKLTVSDSERGLQLRKWTPFAGDRPGQASDSEA